MCICISLLPPSTFFNLLPSLLYPLPPYPHPQPHAFYCSLHPVSLTLFPKKPYRLKFGLAKEAVVVLIRLLEEIDREYES